MGNIYNLLTVVAIVLYGLVLRPCIRAKVSAAELDEVLRWVGIGVRAAEQLFSGSGKGAEKKQYVLDFLEEHGCTLNESEIDAMIEAAVLDLKRLPTQ